MVARAMSRARPDKNADQYKANGKTYARMNCLLCSARPSELYVHEYPFFQILGNISKKTSGKLLPRRTL
jgi:hypothetical protein